MSVKITVKQVTRVSKIIKTSRLKAQCIICTMVKVHEGTARIGVVTFKK